MKKMWYYYVRLFIQMVTILSFPELMIHAWTVYKRILKILFDFKILFRFHSLDLGAWKASTYPIPLGVTLFHLNFIYIAVILCQKINH